MAQVGKKSPGLGRGRWWGEELKVESCKLVVGDLSP